MTRTAMAKGADEGPNDTNLTRIKGAHLANEFDGVGLEERGLGPAQAQGGEHHLHTRGSIR